MMPANQGRNSKNTLSRVVSPSERARSLSPAGELLVLSLAGELSLSTEKTRREKKEEKEM
jgi:hypothetical protein|uniref:Uncharacterized protein n=1 Tax=Oryza sativa subsp. japonica TaxID=39947 RepID=Q6EUD9_ORYSJ|nr:hypothetical protein [Oryza sativa Japonica Group]